MRSRPSITSERIKLCALLLLLSAPLSAQRLGIVTPERTALDRTFVSSLSAYVRPPIKLLDHGLADTAFRSAAIQTPFNMSVTEARSAAAVIGSEFLLLVRTGEQRRTSFSRPEYYEAFAFLYLVDGRTGRLISWRHSVFEAGNQADATRSLSASIEDTARVLTEAIHSNRASFEQAPEGDYAIEEVPADGSPAALGLKPPIPYRRIKPAYTEIAFLYDVRATIDAEVDIGADGTVLAISFVRWAGFGLEESVANTVRSMNWRPAIRNGKPLPMRILLRYNFTKVDKD